MTAPVKNEAVAECGPEPPIGSRKGNRHRRLPGIQEHIALVTAKCVLTAPCSGYSMSGLTRLIAP